MEYQKRLIKYSSGFVEVSSVPIPDLVFFKNARNKKTPEECEENNLYQSSRSLQKLFLNNFATNSFSVVLTFSNEALATLREKVSVPEGYRSKSAQKKYVQKKLPAVALTEARNLVRRLSYLQSRNDLRYVMVVSNKKAYNDKTTRPVRLHVHLILHSSDLIRKGNKLLLGETPIEKLWRNGTIRMKELYHPSYGSKDFSYLARYLVRQSAFRYEKHKKKYISSVNAVMPEERKLSREQWNLLLMELESYQLVSENKNSYNSDIYRKLFRPPDDNCD